MRLLPFLLPLLAALASGVPTPPPPPSSWVGPDRCVLQTGFGDIELAFWTGPESRKLGGEEGEGWGGGGVEG